MSPEEENIQAFVELIESKPSLFSVEDQANLWHLVLTLPNNAEQISNAIAEWCQSRDSIRDALVPLTGDAPIKLRIVGKSPNPKDHHDMVLNSMRESFPTSKPQQPTPEPPPDQKPSNSQP